MLQLQSLEGFRPQSVLSESSVHKSLVLLGTFEGQEGQALVVLIRSAFRHEIFSAAELSSIKLKEIHQNDIYYKFSALASEEHTSFDISVIFPASPKHIAKYSTQALEVLVETPEMYDTVTLPYINAIPAGAIQWVYNVLDLKKESEKIILHDTDPQTGFVLLPDSKWNGVKPEEMYCQLIVNRRDLKTIRDLDTSCLPLLENIKAKGAAAISEKYGVPAKHQRIYFHYHPSYYHMHVHFVHTGMDATNGMTAGKAHMIDTVIDNLTLMGDYYRKAKLPCVFGESDKLLEALHASVQSLKRPLE